HYYRSTKNNESSTTLNIEVINENELLVGCLDGLFLLTIDKNDPKKYTFSKYEHGSNVPREFDITYNIQKYKNENQFLIGTRAGVILFDFKKSTFKYLYNKTGVKN